MPRGINALVPRRNICGAQVIGTCNEFDYASKISAVFLRCQEAVRISSDLPHSSVCLSKSCSWLAILGCSPNNIRRTLASH